MAAGPERPETVVSLAAAHEFIVSFSGIAQACHRTSVEKGFWKDRENVKIVREDLPQHVNKDSADLMANSAALALVHSEISEAVEGLREGNPPDDKIPEYSAVEAELADTVIRIMELAAGRKWKVAQAIIAKLRFNNTREYMHGKRS